MAARIDTEQPAAVCTLVIGGGAPGPDGGPPRRDVVDTLHATYATSAIPAWSSTWASGLAAGAPWQCYGTCGCAGVLSDPSATAVAAEAVYAGQVTFASRAEIEQTMAPADPAALERRSGLLTTRVNGAGRRGGPTPPTGKAAVELLTHWARTAAADRPVFSDEDVVACSLALRDPLVRDAAIGLAFGEHAQGARRLWSALVTETPDPQAAEPAVLLACSALVAGDGPVASVALERALRSRPGHRLATLIQIAVASGIDLGHLTNDMAEAARDAVTALTQRDAHRPGR